MNGPLETATQSLVATVVRMADEGVTSPEHWNTIGDVVLQHGGRLERHLRIVDRRPDSVVLTAEILGPILETLAGVAEHLSPMARAWLRIARHRAAKRPVVLVS